MRYQLQTKKSRYQTEIQFCTLTKLYCSMDPFFGDDKQVHTKSHQFV